MKRKVSADLPKFNRIEEALRQAIGGLGRADQEFKVALSNKRTSAEKNGLVAIRGRCKTISGNLKRCWEDLFALAEGEKIGDETRK